MTDPITVDALTEDVVQFYWGSTDFNGLPVYQIEAEPSDLVASIIAAVRARRIDVVRGDWHPNPHIKALPVDAVEDQIAKLEQHGLGHICLYPTKEVLESRPLPEKYTGKPFDIDLARGEEQLAFRHFNLTALEWYRNDPRFYYNMDGVRGQIYVKDSSWDPESKGVDSLSLPRFGVSFNDDLYPAVAVSNWDLHKLSAQQQVWWKQHELPGQFYLHPDFAANVAGHWSEGISLYDAVLQERRMINDLADILKRPSFFRTGYTDNDRPRELSFLVRPTRREFDGFVHMLDKLLSDDIDVKFFRGEVPTAERATKDDGSIVNMPRGSIAILDEWIAKHFSPPPEALDEIKKSLKTLRDVRKLRQKPAHSVSVDEFDMKYIKEQRDLMKRVFRAVRTIRMMLSSMPGASSFKEPDWYENAKIWTL